MNEERTPPVSDEGEKGLLGAALLDGNRVLPLAVTMELKADDFYAPGRRLLAGTLLEMFAEQRPIDLLTVEDRLRKKEELEKIGGADTLHRLVDGCGSPEHAGYYLDLVLQASLKRRIISRAREVEQAAHEVERGDSLLMDVPGLFAELIGQNKQDEPNGTLMQKSINRWEVATEHKGELSKGLTLPWEDLTELLCGLEVGVTILAGRPSAGKTMLEDCISTHIAAQGRPVARATLDSEREELLERAICRKAGVSLPKLKFGYAGQSQLAACREAKATLEKYPMYITSRHRDVRAICSWARAMKLKHGIELLTVDFVQLIWAPEMGRSQSDEVARLRYVSQTFKSLTFELGIPVLLLAQLNRESEKDERDPRMSDLKGCGGLEEDASKVLLLHRDNKKARAMEEAAPGATKHKRPICFSLVKHKNGETGKIPMWMRPAYFRFDRAADDFSDDAQEGDAEDAAGCIAPCVFQEWPSDGAPAEPRNGGGACSAFHNEKENENAD